MKAAQDAQDACFFHSRPLHYQGFRYRSSYSHALHYHF